jgi:hypothetical protein
VPVEVFAPRLDYLRAVIERAGLGHRLDVDSTAARLPAPHRIPGPSPATVLLHALRAEGGGRFTAELSFIGDTEPGQDHQADRHAESTVDVEVMRQMFDGAFAVDTGTGGQRWTSS